jgi:hypothetical protein
MMPVLKRGSDAVANVFGALPPATQDRIRQRLRRRTIIKPDTTDRVALDHLCIRAQVSQVHHSPSRLVDALGYQPVLDEAAELETTAEWLRFIGKARHEETVGVA